MSHEFKTQATEYFSGKKPCFATTLVSILVKVYGVEALNWDAVTIQLEIRDSFGVEQIPRAVFDKMMALISALTTDSVYKEVPVFDEFVGAINGYGIGTQRGIPSVDDVAWAVTELGMNDPEPVTRDPKNPWSRGIAKYVRVVLDDEGMSIAPEALGFAADRGVAQEGMDNPDYYAAAWGSAQEKANETDMFLERTALALMQQLIALGIEFETTE